MLRQRIPLIARRMRLAGIRGRMTERSLSIVCFYTLYRIRRKVLRVRDKTFAMINGRTIKSRLQIVPRQHLTRLEMIKIYM